MEFFRILFFFEKPPPLISETYPQCVIAEGQHTATKEHKTQKPTTVAGFATGFPKIFPLATLFSGWEVSDQIRSLVQRLQINPGLS